MEEICISLLNGRNFELKDVRLLIHDDEHILLIHDDERFVKAHNPYRKHILVNISYIYNFSHM